VDQLLERRSFSTQPPYHSLADRTPFHQAARLPRADLPSSSEDCIVAVPQRSTDTTQNAEVGFLQSSARRHALTISCRLESHIVVGEALPLMLLDVLSARF
jgi:hypothetical protein